MFQIKTRVDYGLIIMLELAANDSSPLSLTGLAKRLKVTSAYLIQISQPLTKAGLIKSREGTKGGYTLAKPAGKISLLAIFEALEGDIKRRCVSLDGKCPNAKDCKARGPWDIVLDDIKSALGKRSLASLVGKKL
ncbi:MAG: Rrf2 family transcriptional regulator [Candidatus Falkowbacteria bacterium]|nr:MAG: Rrf2 family transcriptional regulator [Candidatus Falkowbacteria bacterium]